MIEVNNRSAAAFARWTALAGHVAFRIVNLDVLASYIGTTPTLVTILGASISVSSDPACVKAKLSGERARIQVQLVIKSTSLRSAIIIVATKRFVIVDSDIAAAFCKGRILPN